MRKITVVLLSLIMLSVISPPGLILAQDAAANTGAVTMAETDGTGYLRAVFAQYLAVIPNEDPSFSVNCAISISNVCAIPSGSKLDTYLSNSERPDSGSFAIVLFDRDGTEYYFSSRENTYSYQWIDDKWQYEVIGAGLNPDGTLAPGQTFTVNLQEVLAAVQGVKPSEVGSFVGYGWVLSEFDCLAGTYSNTIYGLGFTQAFELQPAMGQGGFLGGIMLPVD